MILHTENKNNKVKSGLICVATPIGNLTDITLRALDVLKKSDYILCEDTRISKNLLDRYEIRSKLISNHKFNERKNLSKIIDILKSDCVVSLISDAGTPSVSDPGAILINECVEIILIFFQYQVHLQFQLQSLLVVLMKNTFSMDSFLKKIIS